MDKAKSIISKLSSKLSPSKSAAGSQSGSGKQAGEEAIEASKPDGQAQSSSGSQPGPLKSPYPPIDIPRLSVSNFLFHSSYSKPADKEAEEAPLFFNDEISLSFAECRSRALKVATGLRKRGWKKGDVMSLFAPNQVDYLVLALAALLLGVQITPTNPGYKSSEFGQQLVDSSAKGVITSLAYLPAAKEAIKELSQDGVERIEDVNVWVFERTGQLEAKGEDAQGARSYEELFDGDGAQASWDWEGEEKNFKVEEDVAFLCYSSGTSGKPKGVKLSHRNVLANILQNEVMVGESFGSQACHIDILPQFHCYALVMTMLALKTATPRYIMDRFNLDKYLSIIEKRKVTFGFVAPPVLLALVKTVTKTKYDVSSLKRVASGAAPLSEDLRKRAKELLGFVVTDGYGLTEMTPVISLQKPSEIEIAPTSCGRLVPDCELRVIDVEKGQDLGPNEAGELWVRGPNRMIGYLNNEEATKNAFTEDGWLKTGDVGHYDENGFVYVTDRIKDLIKVKGFQVSVAELESVLISHSKISDAAVVGYYEASQATELPVAFIVAAPGVDKNEETKQEIREWFDGKVAYYKKLKGGIEWIDEVPKSAAGKVLHKDLKAKLMETKGLS